MDTAGIKVETLLKLLKLFIKELNTGFTERYRHDRWSVFWVNKGNIKKSQKIKQLLSYLKDKIEIVKI